jgi:hypothetical protein
MATLDPLQQLLTALENENATLLKSIASERQRIGAIEQDLTRLFSLVKAQGEQLNKLAAFCEALSKR